MRLGGGMRNTSGNPVGALPAVMSGPAREGRSRSGEPLGGKESGLYGPMSFRPAASNSPKSRISAAPFIEVPGGRQIDTSSSMSQGSQGSFHTGANESPGSPEHGRHIVPFAGDYLETEAVERGIDLDLFGDGSPIP